MMHLVHGAAGSRFALNQRPSALVDVITSRSRARLSCRRCVATRLRDLHLRCGHCGARGQAPVDFTLFLPSNRDEAAEFMRGKDVRLAVV
jgi:hypothetical protein